MARQKSLDDTKRNEICALTTAGMSLAKIACYVGCHPKTIRRERQANPEFDQRMRRAELAVDLSPLEAMRRASRTYWRAAAWMIDRADRKLERRQASCNRFTRRDVEKLCSEIRHALLGEVEAPDLRCRIQQRLESVVRDVTGIGSAKIAGPATATESMRLLDELWDKQMESSYNAGPVAGLADELGGESAALPIVPAAAQPGTIQQPTPVSQDTD